MDPKPKSDAQPKSRWEVLKEKGLAKMKEAKKTIDEKTKPVREAAEEAGEVAKGFGQGLKAMYWDLPKAAIEEYNKNERKEPQVKNAVQPADKNARREEELESEGVRERRGKDSKVRRP
jgi:predicted kinase